MRKNFFYTWLIVIMALLVVSCSDDEDEDLWGNWIKLGSFEGIPRTGAVAFTVGDYAYVGTGYNGDEDLRLKDFWKYDPVNDYWTQIEDLPGVARNYAVAFNADGKGYVTTGFDGKNKLDDLWAYDPSTNTWEQKADFIGSGRYDAIAFSISDKGYVGTGYDNNLLKDMYQYNPSSDTWTKKVSVGGSKRRNAVAFVIKDKAYVCTGMDNGEYLGDLWEYDPDADSWTEKRKIENDANEDEGYDDDYEIVGIRSVAFVKSDLGYITTGGPGYPGVRTWEYDPIEDLWTERSEFEGSARYSAVAFTLNNIPYVGTGNSSSVYFDDLYKFDPNAEQDDDD
ncbi:Kelch repeat-containing protein [Carboxylicivirga linearis]|uniref:Galactose oxidase n=1 Tax=Carboxylicivirga linearis TaxID=1628157 RepID=A0ABS5JY56_9BACT|nr:kelch repeat-containing protein [Carboxylicivirga linearis]MBS2099810.1 galactose oxidase [Carboxylicivirga linearis]